MRRSRPPSTAGARATVIPPRAPGADIRLGDADDPLLGVVRIAADDERDVDLIVGRHRWQQEMLVRAEPVMPVGSGPATLAPINHGVRFAHDTKGTAGSDQNHTDSAAHINLPLRPLVRTPLQAEV